MNETETQIETTAHESLPLENSTTPTLELAALPEPDDSTANLQNLLNNGSYRLKEERALIQRRTVEPASQLQSKPATFNLQGATPEAYECVIAAPPTANSQLSKRMRTGKIARLPKLERDMVNKLLQNHIPYSKIVWALAERGITATERNISNWRTRGGYKEWCAEQENQLRLSHLQDHLTDYIRKHDAQQLPEVGLQVAATQLTSLLMNPHTAAPILADPNKFARIVDSLDKCSARLSELQKERYENVRRSAIKNTIPNLLCKEADSVESIRQIASAAKLGNSIHEEDIPHRNALPPREEMPRIPAGKTLGEMISQMTAMGAQPKPKQLADAPSNVAQPAVSGNQTETHGSPR